MDHQGQLAKLGLFDARVPRYTSYPTAPHFSDVVQDGVFQKWVHAIPENSRISLYLHIPFCRNLCWFCACRTQGTQTDAPVRGYLDHLKNEIALLKDHLPSGVSLSRMHWGGGTPTLMAPDMIEELAEAVAEVVPMAEGAEFSVEIDPNQFDEPRLNALARKGMTRASVGVQDFHPDIQHTIGRIQSFDVTRDAISMIRERGIESVNADILFGLPHQSKARIAETVQKLMSLSPDRVALYGYAHVPWMAKRQQLIPTDALPTPVQRLNLFETARRLLLWDGYREIGIDHFAKPGDGLDVAVNTGKLRRNFQGYTDDTAEALIGLGASAISKFPQGYAQNQPATADYVQRINERRFATSRGHVFKGEDKMRARMIEALMCDFRIDRTEIQKDFAPAPDHLEKMFADVSAAFPKMIEVSPSGLQIKKEGQPLTRMIARAFDAYDLSKAGHSPAM